ncbi:thiamine pyrophosphate-binding protein [Sphingomonas oligophenolica]|uniref:Thiamine pyrophosphate-binding protein n=1 Tax=Sphingomonas oligophenolica TaxID=301154 RepID=A0ABU9YBA1_9SPHN
MSDFTGKPMKVHQAIARALVENGVDTIFGLCGDANMFMVDSFVHDCRGTFIAAAHEAGSAMMALGYALISGKVGICSVTHGPALTNTVTALVEGVKGSIPMVLVCGDTAVEEREHNQNVPQRDIVVSTGAGFEQLRSPRTATEDVARAMRRAMVERRPIALNVPYEFDFLEVEYRPVRVYVPESRATITSSDDVDNAVGIIAAARRPVVLAGRGAAAPEAKAAIVRLAKRIEAPLATTLKGKDLFRGEDYNLGICGTLSTPIAVETLMESDCIIAFGASLTSWTTSQGAFRKGKRIVQINLEPSEIGKSFPPDAGLVGDPAGTADIIVHWLDEAEIPASGWYSDGLRHEIASYAPQAPRTDYDNGTVDVRGALLWLDSVLPSDRIVVTDRGRFMLHAWTLISVPDPQSFLPSGNVGSIGLGFPHAVGAALAAPGRPIVLVTGDGGFIHGGVAEFNTAVRYNLDLITIVCNDSAYGAEISKFEEKYQDRQMDSGLIAFDWPDFASVAKSLGGEGVTVRTQEDFAVAVDAINNRRRPLLIDIKLDPSRMAAK